MSKDNTIKQCVLICEPLGKDYDSSNVFLKIGSTSLIDHCVSWLFDNGIKQIFLFYSNSKNEIEQLYTSYQAIYRSELKFSLHYVKPEELTNFGDVMRQVQFRNIISQDFLVMFADTISNLDLSRAITKHFKNKIELKSVVLTTILRQNSYDKKIHVTSLESGQILQIDEDQGDKFNLNQQRVNLKKINVQFRRDLTHCDIYLCTVDVFKSFKQNYEYATMFDFINGMLTSEVYEEKIMGHVLDNHEHCYRINKAKDYYMAYVNYISNHFYPYTLTNKANRNFKPDDSKFVVKNFNRIIYSSVSIPRTTHISNTCYVGNKSIFGKDVQIQKSIISNGCEIMNGSKLTNCILLQGCVIAEKAIFQNCLIQKVNGSQQIRRFKISGKRQVQIVSQPLFEETPPPEESTFLEELQQVLSEGAQVEIVGQLNSIRLHHDMPLDQFSKEMIQTLIPQKLKKKEQVQEFVKSWGQILLKVHEDQHKLMDSLYYSCINIKALEITFHIFIQYFYGFELLKDFMIESWYQRAIQRQPESVTLQKCQAFINVLKQSDDEDEEEEQEETEKNEKEKENESDSDQ